MKLGTLPWGEEYLSLRLVPFWIRKKSIIFFWEKPKIENNHKGIATFIDSHGKRLNRHVSCSSKKKNKKKGKTKQNPYFLLSSLPNI